MKDVFIDLENFKKQGFYALEDTTKAPFGSLRIMRNAQVTDRGGLSPREGTELLGTYNETAAPIRGMYTFKKSFGSDELLLKYYDDELEFLSKNYLSTGWNRLKNAFQAHAAATPTEMGFVTSLVNNDNEDYTIFCNRYQNYMRWPGATAVLDGALAGGETTVTVDDTLHPDVYESKTATTSTATVLTVASATWATDQWIGFYVHILAGAETGKVRLITDSDGTTITFDTLGADPGDVAFEIRKLKFPASGTLVINGSTTAYSAVPTSTTLTVTSAPAAADGAVVTVVPTEYSGNPRGDRLTNYLARIVVGNVRSALTRDSGGALRGYSAAGSYFVSKLNNPVDFTFSATRVAGEGDIISTPYGGGDITDVQHQEDAAYVFKGAYIESVKYTQDANDLAAREPLKAGIGSVGKTVKGADDIYFITPDKMVTSIGRVRLKDIKPSTLDIGTKIKRFLSNCVVDDIGRGKEIGGKVYFPVKSSTEQAYNDVLLIWNKDNNSWEGIWDIGAYALEEFNGDFVYGESNGPNVYKLFKAHADVVGTTRHAIYSQVATHFANLSASKADTQAMSALFVEGYIRGGTEINFNAWRDMAEDPFLAFTFATDETGLLDGEESQAYLGGAPLAIDPLAATFSDPDADGRRHFSFRVYFPYQYGNYFSVGHWSNGADFDYEITRYGLGMKEDPAVNTNRIKSI